MSHQLFKLVVLLRSFQRLVVIVEVLHVDVFPFAPCIDDAFLSLNVQ